MTTPPTPDVREMTHIEQLLKRVAISGAHWATALPENKVTKAICEEQMESDIRGVARYIDDQIATAKAEGYEEAIGGIVSGKQKATAAEPEVRYRVAYDGSGSEIVTDAEGKILGKRHHQGTGYPPPRNYTLVRNPDGTEEKVYNDLYERHFNNGIEKGKMEGAREVLTKLKSKVVSNPDLIFAIPDYEIDRLLAELGEGK